MYDVVPSLLTLRFNQTLRLNSYTEGEEKVGAEDVIAPVNDVFSETGSLKGKSLKEKITKAVRGTSRRLRRRSYDTGSLSGLSSL